MDRGHTMSWTVQSARALRWLRETHQQSWHRPIRAETYAVLRIGFASCLLLEQLVQYLPNLSLFFGPDGMAPRGLNDGGTLDQWQWALLLFNPDSMSVVWAAFLLWMAATIAMLLGWRTRWVTVLVWLGAMCFITRNIMVKNSGDEVLRIALFVLMLSPCGEALSLDSRREKTQSGPGLVPPWGVRLLQWQLAFLYLSTGLAKANGDMWWDGSVVHYVIADVSMAHFSPGILTLPFFLTQAMTRFSLGFELLFLPLVLFRKTRFWVLAMGIGFHCGILLLIEAGWFGFYTMSLYLAFIPDSWWERRERIDG